MKKAFTNVGTQWASHNEPLENTRGIDEICVKYISLAKVKVTVLYPVQQLESF